MKPTNDSKPPEVEATVSDRIMRRKHRKDTSAFLWGTWMMLFLTIVLGHDTWQGFRTGQWVDIGAKEGGCLVPWWVAATLALAALLFCLWCSSVYVKLKITAPKYLPGDEDADDESTRTP
jgi:hypothetical protein